MSLNAASCKRSQSLVWPSEVSLRAMPKRDLKKRLMFGNGTSRGSAPFTPRIDRRQCLASSSEATLTAPALGVAPARRGASTGHCSAAHWRLTTASQRL